MSWLDQYRKLARYNQLMNRKLYQAAGKLDDSERKRDRGAFFRSIHGTFNHLMLADRVWMLRFTGDEARFALRDRDGKVIALRSMAHELYEDFGELTHQREQIDGQIVAWAEGLSSEALERTLAYKMSSGVERSHPLWWALGHFFNHQTHHRGQVTTLLSQAGIDPGVTDLVAMLFDEDRFAHG